MSIRQRLFLLLAVVAVVPLVLLAALDYRAGLDLANRQAATNRDALVDDLTRLLGSTVAANARYLSQQADIVRLALQLQATSLERRLAEAPPNVPIVFARVFDGPRAGWPRGTVLAQLGGSAARLPVSFDVVSVLLPPGVSAAATHADLLRVSATAPLLHDLDAQHPGLMMEQFAALANGVRDVFPGHGNYPASYDSRKRTWYRAAMHASGPVWTEPIFSASTKQLTIIVATPLHGPDGRFVGVAADEVAIVELLRRLDLRVDESAGGASASIERISERAASMLVVPAMTDGATSPNALRILAQRSYDRNAANWRAAPVLQTIGGDDVQTGAVVADIAAGRGGIARLPYGGHDSLWAYGPVPAFGGALLLVLPYDQIFAAADAPSLVLRVAAREQLRNSILVTVAILLVVAFVAYVVSGRATKPIHELAMAARRVGAGELDARAEVRGHDEIAALATAFNAMVPRLADGLRMQQGLDLARAVQQNLLPVRPPNIPGFDIAGSSVYCDETGGDYFDFVDLSHAADHRIAIAVGDVSGHGISAALLMASVRAGLRGSIDGNDSPLVAMERANRLLYLDVSDGSFMTLVLMFVDPSRGVLRWVNAAHDPAAVYARNADAFLPADGGDIPLGVDDAWAFTEHELVLPQDDIVLALGTDGIWETEDAGGAQFGQERFRALVRTHAALPAAGLCRTIMDEVARYRGGTPPVDDVTLVIIKFTSRGGA